MEFSTENLKPAFAGLVVDHKVDKKEVFATFVDLVQRGIIDTIKKEKTNIFYYLKTNRKLDKHEVYLINSLFKGKKEINQEEMIKKLNDLASKEEFKEKVAEDAVSYGLYSQNPTEMVLKIVEIATKVVKLFIKWVVLPALLIPVIYLLLGIIFLVLLMLLVGVVVIAPSLANVIPTSLKDPLSWFVIFIMIGILIFVSILTPITAAMPKINEIIATTIFIGMVGGALFLITYYIYQRVTQTEYERLFLPGRMLKRGSHLRKMYLELWEYLKVNPLTGYRWANEYLPYSVVFGVIKDFERLPQ